MQVVNQDTEEAYDISLDFKERGSIYFLNGEQLLNFPVKNKSTIWRNKLQDFKLSYVSSVSEDFKSFSENIKDLYEKSRILWSGFIVEYEDRLRELEEKYKNYRISVLKDTVCVFENIL